MPTAANKKYRQWESPFDGIFVVVIDCISNYSLPSLPIILGIW